MKKVLITGATGFIGNHLISEFLKKNDCRVIASSASIEKAAQATWYPMVQYIPFNIKTFDDNINYYNFFEQPDIMIHLAWEGLPNYKAPFHTEENLPRHFGFLRNCIQHGLSNLTVTGTCFEYGMQEGCLREDRETQPANAYAIAKDMLRKKLEQLQLETAFDLKWVRLFYMYGSGQSPNSLLSQLEKALQKGETLFNMSGGEQERDYLPVEQVALYLKKIALQQTVSGIINCCSGQPVKIKDFVNNYLAKNNKQLQLNLGYYPYSDYEPMCFWGDNEKLKTIIENE